MEPTAILARKELAKRELARRAQIRPSSPFDSSLARDLFRGGGQLIGGLSAGALATPETLGLGTVPAAITGGIGGGLTGESLRQFLASVTGGGPQSVPQQVQQLGTAGMNAAIGEMIPPIVGAGLKTVGKGMGMMGRTIYRNIPDPVMDWVKTRATQGVDVFAAGFDDVRQQLFPVLKRLGDAVNLVRQQAPQVQAPKPSTLYPVAEKAINALDAVRDQVGQQYGQAAAHALEQPARASLAKAGAFLKSELKQAGILGYHNRPQPFGSREFTGEERILLNAYEDLTGMSPHPTEGLPEAVQPGTFINYDMAKRLLGRVDELMASSKLRNTQRILGTVRRNLMDGLKQSDEQLAKRIPQYGQFVGLRDMLESAFTEPDKAVSLLVRSLSDVKQNLRGKLETLDQLAPAPFKFFKDLITYQQKVTDAEVAKRAPKTISQLINRLKSPEQAEEIVRNIFGQKETTLAELESLERLTGDSFLTEIKDFAVRQAFRSFKPTGYGYPTNMMLGGLGGAAGYAAGGPMLSAVGAAGGTMAGTLMSAPRLQAEMLRKLLPLGQKASQVGQTVGAQTAPMVPPAIAALMRSLQEASQ